IVLRPAARLAATASLIASVGELAMSCSDGARANGAFACVCAISECCCCGLCMVVFLLMLLKSFFDPRKVQAFVLSIGNQNAADCASGPGRARERNGKLLITDLLEQRERVLPGACKLCQQRLHIVVMMGINIILVVAMYPRQHFVTVLCAGAAEANRVSITLERAAHHALKGAFNQCQVREVIFGSPGFAAGCLTLRTGGFKLLGCKCAIARQQFRV